MTQSRESPREGRSRVQSLNNRFILIASCMRLEYIGIGLRVRLRVRGTRVILVRGKGEETEDCLRINPEVSLCTTFRHIFSCSVQRGKEMNLKVNDESGLRKDCPNRAAACSLLKMRNFQHARIHEALAIQNKSKRSLDRSTTGKIQFLPLPPSPVQWKRLLHLIRDLGEANAIAGEMLVEIEAVEHGGRRVPHDGGKDRRCELRQGCLERRGYKSKGFVLHAQKRVNLDAVGYHHRVEAKEGVVEQLREILRQALGLLFSRDGNPFGCFSSGWKGQGNRGEQGGER